MPTPTYDHVVIGAGVIGAAAAWRLAQRGGRTLLIEQHPFLHDLGSSHGESRIFRHAYEDRAHVRLAIEAGRQWGELEALTGERLLHRVGGLDLGTANHAELANIEASLRAEGRTVERLGAKEIRERFPVFGVDDDVEALYSADACIVPATRAVATLLRAAVMAGAEVRDREPVLAIEPHAGGVIVRTHLGAYDAGSVVVASGPWMRDMLPDLALPLWVEQQFVLYLKVGADAQAYAAGRMPVFIDRRGGIYGFPVFERPNAIKVSDHQGAPTIELATRSMAIDPVRRANTVAMARTLFPGIEADVLDEAMCLYTKTPDERFVLDRHPLHPQLVLAGGGSGHAFKFGPALGSLAADVVMERPLPDVMAHFALNRWG